MVMLSGSDAFVGLRVLNRSGIRVGGTITALRSGAVDVRWDNMSAVAYGYPIYHLVSYVDELTPLQEGQIVAPGTKLIVIRDEGTLFPFMRGTQVTSAMEGKELIYLVEGDLNAGCARIRFAIDPYAIENRIQNNISSSPKTNNNDEQQYNPIQVFATEATVVSGDSGRASAIRG